MYNEQSIRIEGGGQTCDYVEHGYLDSGGRRGRHSLRFRIHDDSHANQAFAVVERWDGDMWREVASIRGDAMQIKHGVGYRTQEIRSKPGPFKSDRDRLQQLAEEIL